MIYVDQMLILEYEYYIYIYIYCVYIWDITVYFDISKSDCSNEYILLKWISPSFSFKYIG